MILFKDDWDKYPTAIVDTKTKNTSYLRLAALYREMGIANNSFLLSLMNPNLQEVDPFDPDLDTDIIAQIAIECKLNPWYYFREVARVPPEGSLIADRFKANRGNIALYWLFFNHIETILIQIRQTGKSLSTDELNIYLMNIGLYGHNIGLLTANDKLRSENLSRLKKIQEELPYYLNLKRKTDTANTEEMEISRVENKFIAFVPNKSPKAALNVGRGFKIANMRFDEAAFTPNIGISLPAALAAGNAARDNAKAKGDPYGTIITTTAGRKDDPDGRYVYGMLVDSAIFSEKFYDCRDIEELEHVIRSNSPKRKLRVNCTFNHRQLGHDDEWLRRKLEETNVTGEDARRDFFNEWTSGSIRHPLSNLPDILERIKKSETEPVYTEIAPKYGYIVRWYIPEEQIQSSAANSYWIMGLDTSEAIGNDDIALVIKDIKTGETIAAGNYNETNLFTFSEWLLTWFLRIENLVMIPERKSTAVNIVDYLLVMLVSKNINPFKRIYNKVVQERDEYKERYAMISSPGYKNMNELCIMHKKTFGFSTSAMGITSRSDLYGSTLINACKYTCDYICDKTITSQLLGLTTKNGRVDHADGEHDDSVIAWLLGSWLMTIGKNLEYYGIDSRLIYSDNRSRKKDDYDENSYDAQEQKYIKQQINEIAEQIKQERDDLIIGKLENQLRYLYNQCKDQEDMMSYNDLINQLKEQKRLSKPTYNNAFNNHYNSNYGSYSNNEYYRRRTGFYR